MPPKGPGPEPEPEPILPRDFAIIVYYVYTIMLEILVKYLDKQVPINETFY